MLMCYIVTIALRCAKNKYETNKTALQNLVIPFLNKVTFGDRHDPIRR